MGAGSEQGYQHAIPALTPTLNIGKNLISNPDQIEVGFQAHQRQRGFGQVACGL
jgi:hypothetical protein